MPHASPKRREAGPNPPENEIHFIHEGVKILRGGDEEAKREFVNRFCGLYLSTIQKFIYTILQKRGYTYVQLAGGAVGEDRVGVRSVYRGGSLCDEVTNEFLVTILSDGRQMLSSYGGHGGAKFATYLYGVCNIFVRDWFTRNEESGSWLQSREEGRNRVTQDTLPNGLVIKAHPKRAKQSQDTAAASSGGERGEYEDEACNGEGLLDRRAADNIIDSLSTVIEPGRLSDPEVLKLQECLQFAMVKAGLLLSKTKPSDMRALVMILSGVSRQEMARILGKGDNAVSQFKNEAVKRFSVVYKRVLRKIYCLDIDMVKGNLGEILGR